MVTSFHFQPINAARLIICHTTEHRTGVVFQKNIGCIASVGQFSYTLINAVCGRWFDSLLLHNAHIIVVHEYVCACVVCLCSPGRYESCHVDRRGTDLFHGHWHRVRDYQRLYRPRRFHQHLVHHVRRRTHSVLEVRPLISVFHQSSFIYTIVYMYHSFIKLLPFLPEVLKISPLLHCL